MFLREAYEARMDSGRTYACYDCAMPVEQAQEELNMARKLCVHTAQKLRQRRDQTAQFHILVLDSIKCLDGSKPPVEQMIGEENFLLYKMMKTAVVLAMLNERHLNALHTLQVATTHRICCLHRYENRH